MESECRRKWKARFALRRDILKEFLAEFLGIFVLILFGCGSVAQAVLSKGALGEPLSIHLGFTLGLMMAAYIAGGVSGAHVNPAVTLAMVMLGKISWKKFPVYVAAQFLGAFAGACCVYFLNYDPPINFRYCSLAPRMRCSLSNMTLGFPNWFKTPAGKSPTDI